MGQGIAKLDVSESERELLRFTWRVVANADYGNNPGTSVSSRSSSSMAKEEDDASDDMSEHSFSSDADDSPVNLEALLHKKVFHVAFYEKFFKLSPVSRQVFPENKMKMGDILKVILNMGTNHDAATIKRLVNVDKGLSLSKGQFEAFAIAFARTVEYKLDKLCTVYVAKLWERVCMGVAMSLYAELKRNGAPWIKLGLRSQLGGCCRLGRYRIVLSFISLFITWENRVVVAVAVDVTHVLQVDSPGGFGLVVDVTHRDEPLALCHDSVLPHGPRVLLAGHVVHRLEVVHHEG